VLEHTLLYFHLIKKRTTMNVLPTTAQLHAGSLPGSATTPAPGTGQVTCNELARTLWLGGWGAPVGLTLHEVYVYWSIAMRASLPIRNFRLQFEDHQPAAPSVPPGYPPWCLDARVDRTPAVPLRSVVPFWEGLDGEWYRAQFVRSDEYLRPENPTPCLFLLEFVGRSLEALNDEVERRIVSMSIRFLDHGPAGPGSWTNSTSRYWHWEAYARLWGVLGPNDVPYHPSAYGPLTVDNDASEYMSANLTPEHVG